jgi:hypothetical protein
MARSWLVLSSWLILAFAPSVAAAADITCFEDLFISRTGEPQHEHHVFPGIDGPAIVRVYNGDQGGESQRARSAKVEINGMTVLPSRDFKRKAAYLEAQVDLFDGENSIEVTLRGSPGGRIRVQVVQEAVPERAILTPEGGEFEFPNGVILEVPPGAVSEATTIDLSDLPADQVNALLSAQAYAFHEKRYLGGFSVEQDVDFNLPIKAIVPIVPLEPYEVPLLMELEFDAGRYWIEETNLSIFPDQRVAEVEVRHFSDVAIGAVDGIDPTRLEELCTDPAFNPLLAVCEDLDALQPAYCLLQTEDRPADAVCCREKVFSVQAQAVDYSVNRASGECEILFDNVQVTFHDCTLPDGSFAPPQTSALGMVSPHCPEGTVFDVDVEPSTLNLFACEEASLEASMTATAPDGTILFQDVEILPRWDATTPNVIEIDIDGTVRGLSEGTTRVLALVSETSAIPPGEALVNVRSNIRSFSVSPPGVTMGIGEVALLEALPVDSDGNLFDASDVRWSSGDPSVADLLVDTGRYTSVEGVDRGATDVTATFEYECETEEATAEIAIECSPVSFSVDPSQLTLEVGEEVLLESMAQNKDGEQLDVSDVRWASSMPSVAALLIDTTKFTSVEGMSEGGPVEVTATYDDGCQTKEATALVTVECPLISFSVDPLQLSMQVGEKRRLEAVGLDRDGEPVDLSGVSWSSSMPDVAALLLDTGPSASVEGVSEGGPVEVTATYDDGCQIREATAEVTVTPGPLTVEVMMPTSSCFSNGETLTLEAIIKDAEGNEWPRQGPVTWQSFSEGIAGVDDSGLVTARGRGLVTIVASYEEAGEVYTGSILIEVLDLNGLWDVTEVADERDCGDGFNTYSRIVDAEHSGNGVRFSWTEGSASGTKSGCSIAGYGSEREDDGRSFGGDTLTIFPDGKTITGSISWDWTGVDPDTGKRLSCSGSSDLTAQR